MKTSDRLKFSTEVTLYRDGCQHPVEFEMEAYFSIVGNWPHPGELEGMHTASIDVWPGTPCLGPAQRMTDAELRNWQPDADEQQRLTDRLCEEARFFRRAQMDF